MPRFAQSKKKTSVQNLNIKQQELAQSCQSYQQLLGSKLVGITISDSDETILAANDCFLDMLGYTRKDFEEGLLTWSTITPQRYDELDYEVVSELFENKVVRSVEKEYLHKEGHTVPVITGAELVDDCAPLNISYAIQIKQQTGEEREREMFVRTVRHELKTPLAIMKMQAELMRTELPEGNVGRELRGYVREIETQISQIQAVLNDVFNTYQYANENVAYRRPVMDIQKLVMEVVENTALISGRRITLKTLRVPCLVRANKARQRQVFVNIINNAIKYSPADSVIEVSIAKRDGNVGIAFKDYGRGIPKTDLRRIFKQSYRVRNFDDYEKESSGIGLYLCDLILRQVGGRIDVTSELHRGSTFTVVLPLVENQP